MFLTCCRLDCRNNLSGDTQLGKSFERSQLVSLEIPNGL